MSEWNVAQPLDYSATGDDIDSASQKIIATFVDVYDKLNRLRSLDASAEHTVGDAAAYSIKIDTSVTPAAILMRNAANTGYIQIGSVAENMGITAEDVGAIQGEGMGKISLGAEANLPSTATTYDLYFAYDTGRLYMYRTGAWRVFLSLRFEDLLGISDAVVERDEVAANGANKIPRLNSVGQGEFDITGSAAKIGGKNLYIPELHDNQVLVYNGARDRWEVAPRDELTNDDVSTTGEPDKIVKTDSNSKAHIDITGSAEKIATKTIDVSNLQGGDVLVYDATHGTFVNKQGAVVNAQGVIEANVSGSAAKWGGKVIQTVSLTDGQILVWSESNQAWINRNQGSIGSARSLVINQDGEEKANYNGDTYRNINIITPHLRVASQEYTANQTCFSKNMASTLYLECTTPGVTAAVEPDFSSASIGDTVADGGVEWKVCGYVNTEITDALDARITAEESLTTHNYRQPSTTYAVNDIKYHATLPTGWYLECTTDGISDSGELVISSPSIGDTVTDGMVVWTIKKTPYTYTLPASSASVLGGVKTGSNITNNDGTISLSKANVTNALGYTPPTVNTTYSNFVKSGSGAKAGLVPAPSTTAGTTHYLREDGTWQAPPNTTYGVVTSSSNGLMTPAMLALLGSGGGITAASLAANGYVKFANGFIVQWGNNASNTGTATTVTFPIAFTSACYAVTLGVHGSGTGKPDITRYNISSVSKTGFVRPEPESAYSLFWIAIGK